MFAADHPLCLLTQAYQDLLPHMQNPNIQADAFSKAMSRLSRHVFLLEASLSRQTSQTGDNVPQTVEHGLEDSAVPNAFFEALFSLSPMGTVAIDEDGLVLMVNQAFLDMFGYRHHEVFNRNIDEVVAVSPKIRNLAITINTMAVKEKKPQTCTTIREKKDGTRMDVLFTEIPFRVHDRWFACCIYHDISEGVQSQKTLRRIKKQLRRTLETTLRAFSKIMKERDPYTEEHQQRVASIAALAGRGMGMHREEVENLFIAALLHDIGKVAIPAQILAKPGTLNEAERNIVKGHPGKSHEIVGSMKFQGPVAECILQHHERLDGSGYPKGLRGDEIVFPAQILAVADVFEAMTSHRPYRPARQYTEALEELKNSKNVKYNALAVEALEKLALSGKLEKTLYPGLTGYNKNVL